MSKWSEIYLKSSICTIKIITEESIKPKIETSIYIGQGDGEFEVVSYVVLLLRDYNRDCPRTEI